jgi:DNA repair protein RecO (recombination protein O)
MSNNIAKKDIRTLGYVLRRVNYAEFDRILNLITPQGKIVAIAKGVRKEKSKLAGSIEVFSLTDFNIHFGRSEFGLITGAKMQKHYKNIVKDLSKMEIAAMILKKIDRASENSDNPEYFRILEQGLVGLDSGVSLKMIEAWFLMNLRRTTGEEINLYRSVDGEKLSEDVLYSWDVGENAFIKDGRGEFGANEIKILRLLSTVDLKMMDRVKINDEMIDKVLRFVRIVG